MPRDANVEVEFPIAERTVSHVRVMVHSLVLLATDDRALASRVTVTCAELVENIARRGPGAVSSARMRIELKPRAVRVEVSFETHENEVRTLEACLRAANQGAPAEAYTHALTLTSVDADDQLRLARIRYEGQMVIASRRAGKRFAFCAESAA